MAQRSNTPEEHRNSAKLPPRDYMPAVCAVNGELEANTTNDPSFSNKTSIKEFVYSEEDLILAEPLSEGGGCSGTETKPPSRFDITLQTGWLEKMALGFFRYNLGELETRILPGDFKFIAQLNIQRGLERRKPQDIQSIQQRFDPHQFNFNKIQHEEVLFQITKQPVRVEPHLNLEFKIQECKKTDQGERWPTSRNACGSAEVRVALSKAWKCSGVWAVINVSPLEFGHVLFIPDPALCLPQILTADLIQFGIESVLLSAQRGFRVGFNSLGGFASVNHLHLHGFYLDHKLFIESASTEPLCPEKNFHLLSHFPARAFLFYTNGHTLEELARIIQKVTDCLVAKNIAHNLFVTRGCAPWNPVNPQFNTGIRIFIWARKSSFGAKEETAFNVALCELAGHLPIKNQEDFSTITEASAVTIVQQYLLPEDEFSKLTTELVKLLSEE
ncbi:GDP-D-glucose phosphorylase 1 [Ambystoma mexicanum]|uniref:GDP-D-glucose phosphorylase 1 n=1 Tax=Ambystoma mexicanum TaxID=8296 RepID=UPI0037E8E8B8